MAAPSTLEGCSQSLDLEDRPLLSPRQAAEMAVVFKILASDTRLRLLHALIRKGEMCVTDLASMVDMKPQAISNQLQRLVAQGILGSRRNGNNIYYQIVDPCVVSLLDQGLCLSEDARERRP